MEFTWASLFAVTIVFTVLFGTLALRKYLKVSQGEAAGLVLLAALCAAATVAWRLGELDHAASTEEEIRGIAAILAAGLIYFFAIPLTCQLYRKWAGGQLTEHEKALDMTAIGAWLSSGNVVCAVGIAVCAWLGYGASVWGALALTFGALLAYPILNMTLAGGASTLAAVPSGAAGAADELSTARERVFRMLEEGKISADEGAELLSALGEAMRPPDAAPPMSPHRRIVLLGAALVLIGFLLPWFQIDLAQEISRASTQMQTMVGEMTRSLPAPQSARPMAMTQPQLKFTEANISVRGGDVKNGLGWIILLLGIAPLLLPLAVQNLDERTRRVGTVLSLAAGSILVLYLLTGSWRHVSIGIVLVAAGYIAQWIGTVREEASSGRP